MDEKKNTAPPGASVGGWSQHRIPHGRITVPGIGDMQLLRPEDYVGYRCPHEPACGCGSNTLQIAPTCSDHPEGAVVCVLVIKEKILMLQCPGCGGMVGAFRLASDARVN